jgi:hypothetical protein
MHACPATALPRALSALAFLLPCALPLPAQSAAYALGGLACNGGPEAVPLVQNLANPQLNQQILPNEYAYAVANTTPLTLHITGFELFTASVSGAPALVHTSIYRDAGGPSASAHSAPDLNPVATGLLAVAGPVGFYATTVYPPIDVPPGACFWLGAEANAVYPSDSLSGHPGPAPSWWRRPVQGGTAWAVTGIITAPVFLVFTATGPVSVPALVATGVPRLGGGFQLAVVQGPPHHLALLFWSLDASYWRGVPLPFELSPVGAPGCSLYSGTDIVSPIMLDGQGAFTAPLGVPNVPGLAGVTFFNQAAVFVPVNALGLLTTNYGVGRFGY